MNKYFSEILDIKHTLFEKYFELFDYPWLVIKDLKTYISFFIKSLDNSFFQVDEGVFAHKTAKIDKSAKILAPTIIDEKAEIRQGAFIRGSCVIGKNCVVGNSCEIKNSVLFDEAKVPHFNYVGDGILGYKSHFGAGVITSNVKLTKQAVNVTLNGDRVQTDLKKFGAIVGDYTEIGCNCVLNPGTVIGKNCIIYPLNAIRGEIESGVVYKDKYDMVLRE